MSVLTNCINVVRHLGYIVGESVLHVRRGLLEFAIEEFRQTDCRLALATFININQRSGKPANHGCAFLRFTFNCDSNASSVSRMETLSKGNDSSAVDSPFNSSRLKLINS